MAKNLKLAFPKKSNKELKRIEVKFYKNLTDIFLESFKSMNMTEAEMRSRFKFENMDVVNNIYNRNQELIIMCGHYASWEWVFILAKYTDYVVNGIYKKLSNKYFDNWAKKVRNKYNGKLISTKETYKTILKNSKTKNLNLYGFASDQTPKMSKANHWGYFMNNWVPIHTGAEIISKKHNIAVIFMAVKRIKRGYYSASFKKITNNPKDFKNFEISDIFIKLVEKQIYEAPEYYTWTHKRWKHMKPAPTETS